MPAYTSIEKKPIDFDDFYAETGSLASPSTANSVVSKRTKPGKQGKIVAYRMAWDAALDTFVTLHLNINGVPTYPYHATTVQLAAPEQDVFLPVPIPVEQTSLIEVTADVATGSTGGKVTARVIIFYFDP